MVESQGLIIVDEQQKKIAEIESIADALAESEAQKKAIADGFSGGLIFFDLDLKAQWMNKTATIEYPNSLGKSCHEIFFSNSSNCASYAFEKCLKSGQVEFHTQKTGIDGEDGEEIVFEITCSPVKMKHGEISGLIVIAQNVTEKYKLERQLRYSQKMEAIGTLAGGVAHDFNNVLTPIMGYSEIIRLKMKQEGGGDPTVATFLDEILRAARRAKLLVEQVLTFSRSSEKKEKLQYIHPILKEVMKLMRMTLPSTIIIVAELDEECGRVNVDPVQIHQVLINLCTNASHAMAGQQGVLTVKLEKVEKPDDEKGWVQLSIADTGCGIEKEIVDRIFDPYFTTKEKTSGTGMGLAMVHGIVISQGGHIEVESKVGQGSIFRIFLPLVEGESSFNQVVSLKKIQGGVGRILLVDDEEQVVQVTGEILQSLGYTVVGKTSAVEAVKTFNESPDEFDLLISDLTMPELTGLEVSKKVKAVRPDLPVILFTGFSDQVSKDAAVEAGVDEYCMKPISMQELFSIVDQLLNPEPLSKLPSQET